MYHTVVKETFQEHGFNVNQDFPGNFLWEELYRASPKDQKVILTVRDSDEKWWNSWCRFNDQEIFQFLVDVGDN